MSHWIAGKIKAQCSLAELQRALARIRPDWAQHIKSDPSGKLNMRNGFTGETKSGFNLVIPSGSAPDLRYADIGMKFNHGTNEWEFFVDPMGLPSELKNFEGTVLQQVKRQQALSLAEQEGINVSETKSGGQIRIKMMIPVTEAYRLRI